VNKPGKSSNRLDDRSELVWQPVLALGLVELLEGLLSDALNLRYILPNNVLAEIVSLVVTAGLFFLSLFAWLFASKKTAQLFTILFAGWVTAGLIYNIFALIMTMPARAQSGAAFSMLADAVIVWLVNIVIFAVWYWLLDGGGVAERHRPDFLPRDLIFPPQANQFPGLVGWEPGFLDYIFLAFNTSTAFSPTDTFIISRQMKVLTMLQSAISLIALATLAAYAVNLMAN
jgi:uncharacterized membrane protein